MPDLKLKVCGLRDNALEVMEEIQPDFAGFIFYDQSPRFVRFMDSDRLPKGIKKVGVFVNASFEFIKDKIDSYGLDVVQLHGDEPKELCERVREFAEVIKVFSGNEDIDKQQIKDYEPYVDYFLFDTRGHTYGGTGQTFDWQKLTAISTEKPVILSGGIGLEEVKKLKEYSDLTIYAIDVNSRFEEAPGIKNIEELKKLKSILEHEV